MGQKTNTKLFNSGGQTLLHDFRMFEQVGGKVFVICLLVFLMVFSVFFISQSNQYDRYVGSKWLTAKLVSGLNPDRETDWKLPNGKTVTITNSAILNSTEVENSIMRLLRVSKKSLLESLLVALGLVFVLTKMLINRGKKQTSSRIIRGQPIATKKELITKIKKKGMVSPYTLAGIPLPKGSETQHIQFVGTTGTGKTVAIRELLQVIRARGERAIIYDKGGTYVSNFYQEGKDVILNPLDERGKAWDIWQECDDKADFEALAEALMPMPATNAMDPFWVNAARMIFVSAANELKKDPTRSNLKLLQYLLTKDVGAIQKLIQHTESESLVSDKVAKTALNVKAVMATYLKSLTYLKTEGDAFSIRDWVANDENQEFLFVSSNGKKHPTLRPLISAWINTAAKELLSLKPKENRRIWFILDELATLHMLPFLELVKSESRKFGGCFVLGYHGPSQLRKIYGHDGAANLSNFCSTQIFMRLNDPSNTEWSSKSLGSYEVEEVNEGISYGANTMRDGISISRNTKEKTIALPSEITNLDDLEAYIKFKGNLPVTKIKFDYAHYPKISEEFIEREGEMDSLAKEVASLVDKYNDPVLAKEHDELLANKKNIKEPEIVKDKQEKDLADFV